MIAVSFKEKNDKCQMSCQENNKKKFYYLNNNYSFFKYYYVLTKLMTKEIAKSE